MAFSQDTSIISFVAGSTFSSTSLYKFVCIDSSGHVVDPNSTNTANAIGTLYGYTSTTSAAGVEAVPVAVDGLIKVQCAASTISLGQAIAASSAGLGAVPSTDHPGFGFVVSGSSGAAGHVVTVLKTPGAGGLTAQFS